MAARRTIEHVPTCIDPPAHARSPACCRCLLASYPLVVANILAHTLIELADVLAARVAPNGHILMSGVWGDDQVERVVKTYAGRGLSEIEVSYAEGGWALLQATRVEPDTGPDTQQARGVTARAATSTPPPQGFVWGDQEVF